MSIGPRTYKVVARNGRTGEDTDLSRKGDLTHDEACAMMKKFSYYPHRTVMLVETTGETTVINETQTTITQWSDQTFGNKHPLVVAARMNVEVSELLTALIKASYPELEKVPVTFQVNEQIADAICEEVAQLEGWMPPSDQREFTEGQVADIQFECADVLVMLSQVAEKMGGILEQLVNEKMIINRNRSWAKVGGRYQHE